MKSMSEMTASISDPFEALVAEYQNTVEHNDSLFRRMTELTWADPILKAHRQYVEDRKLGFGDAAFHAMWLRLLSAADQRFGNVRAMEIGVFKGQVISLWALIAKSWEIRMQISGITPLKGKPMPRSHIMSWLRYRLDRAFREEMENGNFYPDENYESAIQELFDQFDLNFSSVALHRGFSTDQLITEKLVNETLSLIHI